jgi:electron-transferring-flavoprotein dehydrogenase
VWNVPSEKNAGGWVVHTLGWPLRSEEFGGGFIYNMAEGRVSIGLVVGLDYRDPRVDPHERFQQFKTHPMLRELLDGGSLLSYGAKAIPEGGYWAQPQYFFDGGMIVGDSAGFLNSMRLKGIHLALKSGMLAAQSASKRSRLATILPAACAATGNWWSPAGSRTNSGRFATFIRASSMDSSPEF